jgi:hypothetical protein
MTYDKVSIFQDDDDDPENPFDDIWDMDPDPPTK